MFWQLIFKSKCRRLVDGQEVNCAILAKFPSRARPSMIEGRIAIRPRHYRDQGQRTSTDAPADLLDDLHVRFQSSRWMLVLPCDTTFRPDRGIEWPERDILVLEFF
jgi:hypothetical protein